MAHLLTRLNAFAASLIAIAAAAFCTCAASSAQEWTRQSPYPADVHLHTVHFTSDQHGFIAGEDNLFMVTSDGGNTWSQHSAIDRDPLFLEDSNWVIEFLDAQSGWMWGNNAYRTTDAGVTWTEFQNDFGTIYDYRIATAQVHYAIGNFTVHRTTDGGATYQAIWDDSTVLAADFLDESLGLISWQDGGGVNPPKGVFRTTNAGQSWQKVRDDAFQVVRFLSSSVVVAAHEGHFYRSTDGGASWTLVFSDVDFVFGSNSMQQICVINADALAAIDTIARIWISHDGGQTWTRTQDGYGNWGNNWDIQFPTPEVGFAVGRMGLIFKTVDGGQTWDQLSSGAARRLWDVVMQPSGVGLAVGDQVVLRTESFGQHWQVLPRGNFTGPSLAEHAQFLSVEAVSEDVYLIGGDGDFSKPPLFRSEDGGITWTQIGFGDFGVNWEIHDLVFLDEMNGWLFGFRPTVGFDGILMKTTDGGETWSHVFPLGTIDRIPDGDVRPSGKAWAVHRQVDRLRRSDDFFQTSQTLDLPYPGYSWEAIKFDSDTSGWIAGHFGGLLRTEDSGASYTAHTLPGFIYDGASGLFDIHTPALNEAYVAGHRFAGISVGFIYHTVDGGASWNQLEPITDPTHMHGGQLVAMDVLPTGALWTAGLYGFIYSSGAPHSGTPGDLDGDGSVGLADLLLLLASWGECTDCTAAACPADLTGDCAVDAQDLFVLLGNWG